MDSFLPIVSLHGPPSLYISGYPAKASKAHRWHQPARSDCTGLIAGLADTAVISLVDHVTRFPKVC